MSNRSLCLRIQNKTKEVLSCDDFSGDGATPSDSRKIGPGESAQWTCFDEGFTENTCFDFGDAGQVQVRMQFNVGDAENNWISCGDKRSEFNLNLETLVLYNRSGSVLDNAPILWDLTVTGTRQQDGMVVTIEGDVGVNQYHHDGGGDRPGGFNNLLDPS